MKLKDQNICGNVSIFYSAKCEMRNQNEIIVPTFDAKTNKPCTAIYDLKSKNWTKVKSDQRSNPKGGHLMSFANQTRILYLGGFDENNTKTYTVYELIDDKYWKLWDQKLIMPIGNDTIINIPPGGIKSCKAPNGKYINYSN